MTTDPESSSPTAPVKADRRKGNHAALRSEARLMAVQALYQMDIAQTDLNDIIDEFVTTRLKDQEDQAVAETEDATNPFDARFFEGIVKGVVSEQLAIDPKIQQHLAEGWWLARMDSTLRAILRAGGFELIGRPDVPAKVVINEYLGVAHAFFDGDEPRVVNGVLDRLARAVRTSEFGKSTGA